MEFLDLVETIRAEEASVERLFKDKGVGARNMKLKASANYARRLAEAVTLIANAKKGRVPMHRLQEAMTTSDFPYLFGDILDRQILAAYKEAPSTWSNFAKRGVVPDFRTVKRFTVYGADQVLPEVKEREAVEHGKIDEGTPYEYAVKMYGRKLDFSFQALVNNDLDALSDATERLGRAARRSEQKFVTQLYVGASGPHASLYSGGVNQLTGNPALTLSALQSGLELMSKQVDQNGEPIFIETVELVVPPALEVTALNYLNALQVELTEKGGKSESKLITQNWIKTKFNLNVDYYIPIVASTANGHTSWFLFANPNNGRPALEIGFLRGHEEPEIFMKLPNSVRVGGGSVEEFDFDTNSREYKVQHIFGGTREDSKMTIASNGSGS